MRATPRRARRAPPPAARTALSALVVVAALGSGCAAGIGEVPFDAPPPPPLSIAGPGEGLAYTAADDEDPEAPGIQITVRVDVDDEGIQRVGFSLPREGLALDDVVSEDLAGRRAAFFPVTLDAAAEHPAVARAPGVEVRAVLVAAVDGAQ